MSRSQVATVLPMRGGRGYAAPVGHALLRGGAPAPAKRTDRSEATPVREALARVLASVDFVASRRSRDFLEFIVEETLAGRGAMLSQAAIATRVFSRGDLDPLLDPIVRIQAGRVRRSLERYYLLAASAEALRIEIPRGTYVPVFKAPSPRATAVVDRSPEPSPATPSVSDSPSVVISPFDHTASAPESGDAAVRLYETLVLELGRYADVHAFLQREIPEPGPREDLDRVRFALQGRVRRQGGSWRVAARLVDHATGAQVWAEEYGTAEGTVQGNGSLDDIARVIAARVGAEEGIVVQTLAADHGRQGDLPITPHRAMRLAYRFGLARDRYSLEAALVALREVVETHPECGLAFTTLARLHVANHVFEVTPDPTPLSDAVSLAQRGVRADPSSRRARAVLAEALLVRGELAAARHELEAAMSASPDSLVYLEVIGYLLSLLGDGRGVELIRAAQRRNPHCLPHGSFGLWFDHVRRGEMAPAYEAALDYRDPAFFWRAVMRTCCLAHLDRAAQARTEVAEIVRGRPDFAARGRMLLGRLVKLPQVLDRIADGLAKAGLKLA